MTASRAGFTDQYGATHQTLSSRFGREIPETRLLEFLNAYQPPPWVQGAINQWDALFLYELVAALRPDRVIEIGTASGVSSAMILKALYGPDGAGSRNGPGLFTFDICPHCYFDTSRPVGSAVLDMTPDLAHGMRVLDGKTAGDAAAMFARDPVSVAFIDGDHRHPFPTLDLLTILPAVKPGGWVVLHDVNLPTFAREHEERTGESVEWHHHGAKHLFDLWPHGKIAGIGGAFNIGAIQVPEGKQVTLADLGPSLRCAWEASTIYVRSLARGNPVFTAALRDHETAMRSTAPPREEFNGLPLPSVDPVRETPLRVCMVCSEFVGPHRNGGMGTAVTSLGMSLANHGHDVTFLYTRGTDCLNGTIGDWVRFYADRHITFVPLIAHDGVNVQSASAAAAQSYRVYEWLRTRSFDVIHFPELEAPGYYAMLAKRQGLAFHDTLLCVETHSPTGWLYEAQQQFFDSVACIETDFMERNSVALADVVIGPSAYLLHWMREHGWQLPGKTYVQQYVLPEHVRSAGADTGQQVAPVRELVFFGRLEERKGLRVFCDALDIIARERGPKFTVTFLGKSAQIGEMTGAEFIRARGRSWQFECRHVSHLNEKEAMEYLKGDRRLAVMPSLTDNSPNTVYECIAARIPFIAAHSGGIPELIADDDKDRVTFAVDAEALAEKLRVALQKGIAPAGPAVDFAANENAWLRWHDAFAVGDASARKAPAGATDTRAPLVSICVAQRDQPDHLRQFLESVRAQEYRSLEIIIVDDGSGNAEAVSSIARSVGGGRATPVRVLRQERRGRGAAWNTAARTARGEFLLFVDGQSVLKPACTATFLRAAGAGGADILTSCADHSEEPPGLLSAIAFRFLPLGGIVAAGMLNNYAGSAAWFMRKQIFEKCGEFAEGSAVTDVTWEFQNRTLLAGMNLQVIPEVLLRAKVPEAVALTPESYYREASGAAVPYVAAIPREISGIVPLLHGLRLDVARKDRLLLQLHQLLADKETVHAKLLAAATVFLENGDGFGALPLLTAARGALERANLHEAAGKVDSEVRRLTKLAQRQGRPQMVSRQRGNSRADAKVPALPHDGTAPLVSVVIPCYKQAEFLPAAIESVLNQTLDSWELIVVNDGSPDNTSAVVQETIRRHPFRRIRLIEKANGGLGSARNAGMRAAAAKYILPLDADDRLAPEFLARTIAVLQEHPRVGFVYSHIQHFGARTDLWELPEFDAHTIVHADNTACVCALIRKEMFEEVGGYNETMRPQGYEDWDFWVGCIEKGWLGFRIPEPLFFYRKSKASMLKGSNTERPYLFARIIMNHPGLYDERTRHVAEECIKRHGKVTRLSGNASRQGGLRITYLITSIAGVTGGNQTLLAQANALAGRGHRVTIVTYTEAPRWFPLQASHVRVPEGQPMAKYVPPSDVVISTYFTNTAELEHLDVPVKMYYAQGDQFVFEDRSAPLKPDQEAIRRRFMALSRSSYLLSGVRFVANSQNLAGAVEKRFGRKADAILPVCVDQTVFRPLERGTGRECFRILVVGPDVTGTALEPLTFKGIGDIRAAVGKLSERRSDFRVVRISNSEQQIFRDFPCEFHIAPGDEQKTRLFGTADILVYASHYDSCPRPPLEGMASGAAVVCTSTPGAEEYCRHEENCLLVPPRNPEALCAAIERLMDDAALREHLAHGGFATAAQFPREREWDELEELLFTFLGKEPVGPLLLKHLARQGKFTEALAEAEKLPSDRDEGLQLFKGHCHLQLENLEAAKACFEQALTINPNSSNACEGVGEVFFLAGLHTQSKSMFEWAVRNNPLNAVAIESLARVNTELNLTPTHNSLSGGVHQESEAGGM